MFAIINNNNNNKVYPCTVVCWRPMKVSLQATGEIVTVSDRDVFETAAPAREECRLRNGCRRLAAMVASLPGSRRS